MAAGNMEKGKTFAFFFFFFSAFGFGIQWDKEKLIEDENVLLLQ